MNTRVFTAPSRLYIQIAYVVADISHKTRYNFTLQYSIKITTSSIPVAGSVRLKTAVTDDQIHAKCLYNLAGSK